MSSWPRVFVASFLAILAACKAGDTSADATARAIDGPLGGKARVLMAGVDVVVPLGTRRARPVAVLVGVGPGRCDAVQAALRIARGVKGSGPFLVCPAATITDEAAFRQRVRPALKALKRAYGDYVAADGTTLLADGSASTLALHLAKKDPGFFSRLVVIDARRSVWSSAGATIFARGGGKRVVFACRQACAERDATLLNLERQRVAVRVVRVPARPWAATEWLSLLGPWLAAADAQH